LQEVDDTFEKLFVSKNSYLQKGSQGSYLEALLQAAYLSIISILVEGVCLHFRVCRCKSHLVPLYMTNQAFQVTDNVAKTVFYASTKARVFYSK